MILKRVEMKDRHTSYNAFVTKKEKGKRGERRKREGKRKVVNREKATRIYEGS